jgi:ribonuclease P protein component
MLAAAQRLRRRGEFAAAIRGGRRAGRGSLVVHVATGTQDQSGQQHHNVIDGPVRTESTRLPSRAGFVVSKAVGGAVTRNKVKRRLRALMRERLADLPAGTQVVVRAQPSAAARGYPRLGQDLDAALAAALRPGRPARRGGERGHE